MIDELNGRQILGGYNHIKIRELLQFLKYETTNDIGGERGERLRRAMSGLSFLLLGDRCINRSRPWTPSRAGSLGG